MYSFNKYLVEGLLCASHYSSTGYNPRKRVKILLLRADILAWDRQKKEMDHKTNKLINNIIPNTKGQGDVRVTKVVQGTTLGRPRKTSQLRLHLFRNKKNSTDER